jgi:hypothetical protein
MHKRILVPMDDSARAKAGLPDVQSPSIVSRINNMWGAETRISMTRAENEGKSISSWIRKFISRSHSGGRRRDVSQ